MARAQILDNLFFGRIADGACDGLQTSDRLLESDLDLSFSQKYRLQLRQDTIVLLVGFVNFQFGILEGFLASTKNLRSPFGLLLQIV